MKSSLFYRMIANVYDLLDVIYFRNYERSPRKTVLDAIVGNERILDLCTGTATNAINVAKEKPNTKIIGVDLSDKMLKIAANKVKNKKSKMLNFTRWMQHS